MFFPDRPVRLAHDRYQQFQAGVKRHAFKIRSKIGVDRATGKITAFAADHVLDGGGLANYSASVAVVAATGAIGIYDVPKVDVTTVAVHSRGVTAGSMRGYGTLQTLTALEVLDRRGGGRAAARSDRVPPPQCAEDRRPDDDRQSLQGLDPHAGDPRQARGASDLDRARDAPGGRRAPRSGSSGTGVACVTKDYGTGADCSLGAVEIDRDGRITVRGDAVEMGNGIGTALANRVALHLGAVADEVAVSRIDSFDALGLVSSGDPYSMDQATQDAAGRDPRWVPAISSATSASIGAHVGTKAAAEAARVVFRFGLWPAALELWGMPADDARARQWEEARWVDGALVLADLPPLPIRAPRRPGP